MCLVSIILYRAIMAILVSRSNNTLLAAWVSLRRPLLLGGVEGSGPPLPRSTLTRQLPSGLAHRQLHGVGGEPGLHPRPLQDLRGPGPHPDQMG